MMELRDLIEQEIPLTPLNDRGWRMVLCRVCNDHGKKGLRSGFRFDNDGAIGYNCFNCGAAAVHTPESKRVSDNMSDILIAFGVSQDSIDAVNFDLFRKHANGSSHVDQRKPSVLNTRPEVIEMPQCLTRLSTLDSEDPLFILAEEHLRTKRAMQPHDYPFYIGTKKDTDEEKKWYARLVIPIYDVKGNLIFFQGRDLTDKRKKKYLSVDVPRARVLYGMHQLYEHRTRPLFIFEGFFDACHVNGVACLSRKLSDEQIAILNKSPREKVVVPDQFGEKSLDFPTQALDLGWKVSCPEIGQAKDITEAVVKYGKIYTLRTLISNIYEGSEGRVRAQMFCKEG